MPSSKLYSERLKKHDDEESDWMIPVGSFRLRFNGDDKSLITNHFRAVLTEQFPDFTPIEEVGAVEGDFIVEKVEGLEITGTFTKDDNVTHDAGEKRVDYQVDFLQDEARQDVPKQKVIIELPSKEERSDISLYKDFGDRKTDKRYVTYHWDEVVAEFAKTNPIEKKGLSKKTFNQWVRKNLIGGWTFNEVPAPCIFDVKLMPDKVDELPVIEAFSGDDAFANAGKVAGLIPNKGQNYYWKRKISGSLHLVTYAYSTDEQYQNYLNIYDLIKDNEHDQNALFANLLLLTNDKTNHAEMMSHPALSDKLLSKGFLELVKKAQPFYNEAITRNAKENHPQPSRDEERDLQISDSFVFTQEIDGVMNIDLFAWVVLYKTLTDYSNQWRTELEQQKLANENFLKIQYADLNRKVIVLNLENPSDLTSLIPREPVLQQDLMSDTYIGPAIKLITDGVITYNSTLTFTNTGAHSGFYSEGVSQYMIHYVDYNYEYNYEDELGNQNQMIGSVSLPFDQQRFLGLWDIPLMVLSELYLFKIFGFTTKLLTRSFTVITGFTRAESKVISEAGIFYKSDALKLIRQAHLEGKPVKIQFDGKTIQYEPSLPMTEGYSAMTISPTQLDPITLKPMGESGWIFGPRAFMTEVELKKTILQEMHRLNFSDIVKGTGADKDVAAWTTKNAFEFAEEGAQHLK